MNADTQAFTDRLRAELGRLDKQALVEVVIEYVTRHAFVDRQMASDLADTIHRVRWARASTQYEQAFARWSELASHRPTKAELNAATGRAQKARIARALNEMLNAKESAWREVAAAEKLKRALARWRPKLWPEQTQAPTQPAA